MIHAVALFSGGLDSILAARVIQEQGLRVRCLHFVTPFFGKPHLLDHWQAIYGLEIEAIDVGADYVRLLRERPVHGFGKVMNPCVDCKILMMRHARKRMEELGASFIVSGEVLGQRPMSQRRDTLNVIRRDGDVRDILLRPLCATHLDPTAPELSGLVDRSRLHSIFGRGRKGQIALAAAMGITEIPTPAGGCKLAEKENARRYWPVLNRLHNPTVNDFELSNVGRQGWSDHLWLSIGRNEADNLDLERLARPGDIFIKVADLPGPLGLARQVNASTEIADDEWSRAAALVAACAPKAVRLGEPVDVRLTEVGESLEQGESRVDQGENRVLQVMPERGAHFIELEFIAMREDIHIEARDRQLRINAKSAKYA